MKRIILLAFSLLLFLSCSKSGDELTDTKWVAKFENCLFCLEFVMYDVPTVIDYECNIAYEPISEEQSAWYEFDGNYIRIDGMATLHVEATHTAWYIENLTLDKNAKEMRGYATDFEGEYKEICFKRVK